MAKRKSKRKVQLATLLAVGEGPADKAFIEHMRGIYSQKTEQKVTVKAEDGGSPSVMISNVVRKYQHAAFDRRVLVLDEDVPITAADRRKAKREKVELIVSTPICLEGMLLALLEQHMPVGATANDCKNKLHPQLSDRPTRCASYRELFPKPLLDSTEKEQIVRLRALLSNKG